MALIQFYEKPGCINNTRQKQLLREAGHELIVHDLLNCDWATQLDALRGFFGDRPVAEWFNPSAPAIKNGDVDPSALNAEQALAAMAAQPILIRRPLIECNGRRCSGFDQDLIAAWLNVESTGTDLENCPRQTRPDKAGGDNA